MKGRGTSAWAGIVSEGQISATGLCCKYWVKSRLFMLEGSVIVWMSVLQDM